MSLHKCLSVLFIAQVLLGSALIASDAIYLQYTEGNGQDKTYSIDEDGLTILHLDFVDNLSLERLLWENSDIIWLSQPLEDDMACILYQELKNTYPHFYYAVSHDSSANVLFVASKYQIEDIQCTSYSTETQNPLVLFDFLIKKGQTSFARFYAADAEFFYLFRADLRKNEI
jgi:hypothetical protein